MTTQLVILNSCTRGSANEKKQINYSNLNIMVIRWMAWGSSCGIFICKLDGDCQYNILAHCLKSYYMYYSKWIYPESVGTFACTTRSHLNPCF